MISPLPFCRYILARILHMAQSSPRLMAALKAKGLVK